MKPRIIVLTAVLFVMGVALGYAAARKADSSLYRGKQEKEAGRALLEVARVQAGGGSWERIAVGRVYYLGGMKAEGQALFDEVLGRKADSSDIFRVARVYCEAGEWPRAKELFNRYLQTNQKDDKALAEVGAFALLNGDRAMAEDLFDRSFRMESEMWSTVAAAGAYLGVRPQE